MMKIKSMDGSRKNVYAFFILSISIHTNKFQF